MKQFVSADAVSGRVGSPAGRPTSGAANVQQKQPFAGHDLWHGLYVGLVRAAVLAGTGYDVVLRRCRCSHGGTTGRGEVPIYEPGLEKPVRTTAPGIDYASPPTR